LISVPGSNVSQVEMALGFSVWQGVDCSRYFFCIGKIGNAVRQKNAGRSVRWNFGRAV